MLDHCLRRWSNINPTVCERLVFAGEYGQYYQINRVPQKPCYKSTDGYRDVHVKGCVRV